MFTLGRNISFKYPTHIAIISLSTVAAIINYMIHQNTMSALSLFGGVFLTWALTREVDEKRVYAAFCASGLFLLSGLTVLSIDLGIVFLLLLLLRLISQITGLKATGVDFSFITSLGLFLALTSANLTAVVLVFTALCFTFMQEKNKLNLIFIMINVIVALVFLLFDLAALSIELPLFSSFNYLFVVSLVLSYVPYILARDANCLCDNGKKANVSCLILSKKFFILALFIMYLLSPLRLANMWMYTSVVLGVTVYTLLEKHLIKLYKHK